MSKGREPGASRGWVLGRNTCFLVTGAKAEGGGAGADRVGLVGMTDEGQGVTEKGEGPK